MRTWKQTTEAAKKVGFEVLCERDLAVAPAGAWWTRLKIGQLQVSHLSHQEK